MHLSREDEVRYSRHLILPGVGWQGQERLANARIVVIGAGGLGSPAALYLAAAGVGTLGIVDSDVVELSNLQRQILHDTPHLGQGKAASAAERLADLNPGVQVVPTQVRLTAENAAAILGEYDVVLDGTDNFSTRYLLNDACALLGKPLVSGGIYQFSGQLSVFDVRRGSPCYRCLYPEPPPPETVPSCAEGGILGAVAGVVGSLQALEALKLVLGIGTPALGRLLRIDALTLQFREYALESAPDCPLCGDQRTITTLQEIPVACALAPSPHDDFACAPEALPTLLQASDTQFIDVRSAWEVEDLPGFPGACHIPDHAISRHLTGLDSARDLLVYCTTGARSRRVVRYLREIGYHRAWHLPGGLLAYRQRCPEVR